MKERTAVCIFSDYKCLGIAIIIPNRKTMATQIHKQKSTTEWYGLVSQLYAHCDQWREIFGLINKADWLVLDTAPSDVDRSSIDSVIR